MTTTAGPHGAIPFPPTTARVARIWAEELLVPLDRLMRMHGSTHVSIVRVHLEDTDGTTGTGFTYTLGPGASVVLAMVRDVLAPALEDVHLPDISRVLVGVSSATRRLGRSVFVPALSATDIAAWDLCGRATGLSLARLLGARHGAPIPIYGSGRGGNALSDDELVEQAVSYVVQGLRAVKLRIGARPPSEDLARLSAVRDALPDAQLFVDANERLTPPTATALVPALLELGVDWLEEPFPAEDVDAHRELAASGVRVAAGEHLVGTAEMVAWSRSGAAQVLQPDAALCGGVSTAHATAIALPDATVAFHSLPELHVHLAAASPNAQLVEHFPLLDAVLAESLSWADGMVLAPEGPGTGLRWDEDVVASTRIGTTAPRAR